MGKPSTEQLLEFIGKRFGRWTVLEIGPVRKANRYLVCRCDCGTVREVVKSTLLKKGIHSCGCYARELTRLRSTTHGHTTNGRIPPEYRSWRGMKSRCLNPKATSYADYGGRGISICQRWIESFGNFYADMGPRPEGTTLERIDNTKGYLPGNCTWATIEEQANNMSGNLQIEYEGSLYTSAALARYLGLDEGSFYYFYRKKRLPLSDAIEKATQL